MAVAYDTGRQAGLDVPGHARGRAGLTRRKRVLFVVVIHVFAFTGAFLIAEVAFRLFWSPKYWIHSDRLLIGSGQTEVGKKWWPNTTYRVDGPEFRLLFRTDEVGYRARPEPVTADHPYRIAFVGDSFTEAMQVPYDSTFCAQLERLLNQGSPSPSRVCLNYGISATDLFDYWHRIIHDVLPGNPPDALVLCIFPGNDFQGILPDEGFDSEGRPLRDYFRKPGWIQHAIAWINLHSKFGYYAQRALWSWNPSGASRKAQGPKNWWADPELAARNEDLPALRRCRSLFRAIDEECRQHRTKLCILVVGPVAKYRAVDGQSPLARILARWQIDVPVIDVAIQAGARRDWAKLVFPLDGHLNESGHTYLAREAAMPLRMVLEDGGQLSTRR
jgi:hypothetical protein